MSQPNKPFWGIVKPTKENIEFAAKLIKEGQVVAFPTETVYGLGADATQERAVAKVFAIKNRPFFDPLIVHCASIEMVSQFAHLPTTKVYQKLMSQFWPGPLTILLPKKNIPDLVTSGFPEVAIRIPNNKIALELITKSEIPLAAPSANPFGKLSPTKAEHVAKYFGEKIPLIIDGGPTEKGLESTIIRLGERRIQILRPGPITARQLNYVTNLPVQYIENHKNPTPGSANSHYKPNKPLKLVKEISPIDAKKSRAALFFKKPNFNPDGFYDYRVLSFAGDLFEAASHLFTYLHELGELPIEEIVAEEVPEESLGVAINNRLRKAAL